MKHALLATALCVFSAWPGVARAHPAPFTYLDVRLGERAAELTLVAHVFDVAHDLGIDPPERLFDPATLTARRDAIVALLTPRIRLAFDASAVSITWRDVEPLPDRQSIRLRADLGVRGRPGTISLDTVLFPYDPVHQTFVNVYENDALALQAILDRSKTHLTFYTGTSGGTRAIFLRFMREGAVHFVAPEHIVFLLALVLLGGAPRQLAGILTAFAVGQAVALTLGTLTTLRPPLRIVEPAGALGLIYLGADNLMVKGGRDVRIWIALAVGLLHGFGYTHHLQLLDLSSTSISWAAIAFTMGIEAVLLTGGVMVGTLVARVRARLPERTGAMLVSTVSIVAIVGGVAWFVQRVFFPETAA